MIRSHVFGAGIVLCVGLGCHAARPLVSETADATPDGSCEVESAVLREAATGLAAVRSWDTLFACGLPRDTQVAIGYARARSEGQTAQGYLLAGKTALLPPQDGRTGWGVAYTVGAIKAPGLNVKVDEIRVIGLLTRELFPGLLGHANLGWSHSRGERLNTTQWSLGVETTADLMFAADVFGDDRGRPSVSAGVGYTFGAGFSANLSYALQFDNPRVKSLGIGAKFVF